MKIAIIVDGYSAGRYFPEECKKIGLRCVHVQSTNVPIASLGSIDKSGYIEEFVYNGNLSILVDSIKGKYDGEISCVFAGSEPGVLLADQLSSALGVRNNGVEKSLARRNKYEMVEVLRRQGIRTVEHFKADNLPAIIRWIEKHNKWPVVLKPLSSGGTDGVFICKDMEDVSKAYSEIHGKKNVLDEKNNEVLVQSYLRGDEYVVNSVSCVNPHTRKIHHFISDIWKYNKQDFYGHHIYDNESLQPFNGEIQKALITYIKNVLDALGISFGPSHAEIMMTDEGPVLVEVGARLSGATNPGLSLECLGYNPINLVIKSFSDPTSFFDDIARVEPIASEEETKETKSLSSRRTVIKYAMVMDLATNQEGEVESIPLKDIISKANLKSIFNIKYKIEPGQRLSRTDSLLTSPVKIYLVHEEPEVIKKECMEIKAMAERGFVVKLAHAVVIPDSGPVFGAGAVAVDTNSVSSGASIPSRAPAKTLVM